jgi:Peptidase family M28
VAVSEPLGSKGSSEAFAVLCRLAELRRPPGSEGERAGAQLLADELSKRGAPSWIEQVRVHGTYWVPIGLCTAAAALAGLAGRGSASVGGLVSALAAADDLEIGRRPLRRMLSQRIAHNVLAEVSPVSHNGNTLVIHAHHDAARTGLVFHPAIAKLMARTAGGIIERVGGTPAPLWGAVAGPAAVCAGGLVGRRRLRLAGAALSAGYAVAMMNIAFSRAVPAANDNLSGVHVLLELAEALTRRPPRGLRVLLLSTGSEESFLEAMVRFGERHFGELPRERTTFLCLESVGSPQLMLLSGEGLLRLVRYPQEGIDQLTELAQATRVRLRSPFRYRMATDGQVALRAGYRTAVISSMDWYKAPSNYHWPSDRPENLDRNTIAAASRLAEAFVHQLDRESARAQPR